MSFNHPNESENKNEIYKELEGLEPISIEELMLDINGSFSSNDPELDKEIAELFGWELEDEQRPSVEKS